jgi:glycosyltransferase involved in cell wall biosynthesis
VCVITYNHARYVEECLDSILAQETTFDFEIIVGDDVSQDDTRMILQEYAARYPDRIRLVLQPDRSGGSKNYEDTHSLARGEYVAHVDGDDVILPGKLQRQAELLDGNPQLNIVWHPVVQFSGSDDFEARPRPGSSYMDRLVTRDELALLGPFGPHSSTMYRKCRVSSRDRSFKGNDWFISMELIGDGYAMMASEVLGKYRLHPDGLSGGAVASAKNRELLCRCQLEVIRRFPQHRSAIAMRALANTLLDAVNMQSFFMLSFKVFLRCGALPRLAGTPLLWEFFRTSKRPRRLRPIQS